MNDVLKKIKKLRESKSLTLGDMAKAIGYCSAKGYRDVEIGKTKLTVECLQRIAACFEVSVEYFFEGKITNAVSDDSPHSAA